MGTFDNNGMGETPKILVVMSCYNHEKFVGESIESVLNQTYTNLELHVVNDGSTDKSKEVILSYAHDDRLHLHDLENNTNFFGTMRCFNDCASSSDAKYIAGTSGDDFWKLDKLEKQVDILENHSEYKACFTWDEVIFEDDAAHWPLDNDYASQFNRSRYEWFHRLWAIGNCINACSVLMERSVYVELGGYNPVFRSLTDWFLWLSFTLKYSFYLIPEKLTVYRRHSTNLSSYSGNAIGTAFYTELYLYAKQLFANMEEDFFRKAFPDMILYLKGGDLVAEKILLLLELANRKQSGAVFEQLAMDLYAEHAVDGDFAKLMETRYYLGTEQWSHLIKYHGLASFGLAWEEAKQPLVLPKRSEILLDGISNGTLTPDKLSEYPYNFLSELLKVFKFFEEPARYMQLLKATLYQMQKQLFLNKEKRNVVIIIGSESDWHGSALPDYLKPSESNRLFYGVIPKKADYFSDEETANTNFGLSPEVTSLEIFSKDEHYVLTCMELGVTPDLLVFVDLINDAYDWISILQRYPMNVLLMYSKDDGINENCDISFIFELLDAI